MFKVSNNEVSFVPCQRHKQVWLFVGGNQSKLASSLRGAENGETKTCKPALAESNNINTESRNWHFKKSVRCYYILSPPGGHDELSCPAAYLLTLYFGEKSYYSSVFIFNYHLVS